MNINPYASYQIEIPTKYSDEIKKFCRSAGSIVSSDAPEYAPFSRQVDFWYMAFLIAVKHGLEPVVEKTTTNITPASILSTHPFRITHIQLAFLGHTKDLEQLVDHRKVLDYAIQKSNAGIPKLLQILNDPDNFPLWSILEDIESNLEKQ